MYLQSFKKKGLPHAHMLFTLDHKNKYNNPETIDKYISAELPENNKELEELIVKYMLHGPHTPESPCYDSKKDICDKKFPKNFLKYTYFDEQGFPQYRRRKNLKKKNSIIIRD